MSTAPSSLLEDLRAATRSAHAELDRQLALTRGAVSVAAYVAFLQGSALAISGLEESLPSWAAELAYVPRFPLIQANLVDLGALPAPVAAVDFVIDSRATALGARYVLEGSALGGAVLARAFDVVCGYRHV